MAMLRTASRADVPEPVGAAISHEVNAGVRPIATRFENEAAQTAAATFPPAIDVNAIDDWTVEGSNDRNSTPTAS